MTLRERLATAWHCVTHPLEMMTGHDGRPSFSKFVLVWILVLISCGRSPSDLVVIALLAASHGTKAFIAWIGKSSLNITREEKASTTTSRAETITRTIVDARDPVTGESTPATPGQRLEDVHEARP